MITTRRMTNTRVNDQHGDVSVTAWDWVEVDGQPAQHLRHGAGIGHARIADYVSPEAATAAASRKAHAGANRLLACMVNKYRRGRHLTTQAEWRAWREQYMRDFYEQKRLADQPQMSLLGGAV